MDQLEESSFIMDLSSKNISNNDGDEEELNKKGCQNQVTMCLYPILSMLIHPLYWNTKKAQTLLSSGYIRVFIKFLLSPSPNQSIPKDFFPENTFVYVYTVHQYHWKIYIPYNQILKSRPFNNRIGNDKYREIFMVLHKSIDIIH